MDKRIVKFRIALAAALAVAACLSVSAQAAGPYYAVGISTTRVYVMSGESSWSGEPSAVLYDFGTSGVSLSDVSVHGDMVFVSDKASNMVHILQMQSIETNPHAVLIDSVVLDSGTRHVEEPLAVVASRSGNSVYVVGKSWIDGGDTRHSNYAYLTSSSGDWSDTQTQIGSLADSPMVDVAAYSSGSAIIAHTHIPSGVGAGSTWVSNVNGISVIGTDEIADKSFSPQAIAVHDAFGTGGYGYITNAFTDETMNGGSISVVDAVTRGLVGSQSWVLPDNMSAHGIAAFTLGDTNYLGIVGVGDIESAPGNTQTNIQQAWRIALNSSGLPDFGSIERYIFDEADHASRHYVAASNDGERFWISNGAAQSVITLDSSAWKKMLGLDIHVQESIRQIDIAIPEPSSMTALSALGLSLFGLLKRRRAAATE